MPGRLCIPGALILAALLSPVAAHAQATTAPAPAAVPEPDAEAAYTKTVQARADKIVATLGLSDPAKSTRVRDLIAGQYRKLRDLQAAQPPSPDARESLHRGYLTALSAELTPEQVDKVKDGMTYGVLPLTYRVYQEMLPDLTKEQKARILAELTEAREKAMDGGTSREKHAWFGKYKGRINNYLATQGYDMKRAEKAMAERQKAASTTAAPATGETK